MSLKDLKFDGTINLGHVLTTITMIIGIAIFLSKTETRIALAENRINAIEKTNEGIPDLKTDVAVIKSSLVDIKTTVDDIKKSRTK